MHEIKMILTDLDDTLLTDDKQISERNRSILTECVKAGIKIGFATARSEIPASPYIDILKPKVLILNSGGLVIVDEKVIKRQLLSEETVASLLSELIMESSIQDICVEAQDGYYCNQKDIFKFGSDYSHSAFCDFKSPFRKQAYKLTIQTTNTDALFSIAEKYPECQAYSYAASGWCCILPTGVCKGEGVKLVAEYLNIPLAQVVAFGDDITDLEMLRDAGIGVAMENAIPIIAQTAAYHTLSNESDGVADFIEKNILRLEK